MPRSEFLGRWPGGTKAKVLVEAEWRPTSDFNLLSDKIYRHVIRTDGSPLNGLPLVDMRKYLNWWKLRTCGRNIEFCNLPVSTLRAHIHIRIRCHACILNVSPSEAHFNAGRRGSCTLSIARCRGDQVQS